MPDQLISVHPDPEINVILMLAYLKLDDARAMYAVNITGNAPSAFSTLRAAINAYAVARQKAKEIGWDGILRPSHIRLK